MEPLLEHHQALLAKWRGAMNLVGPGPLAVHYADAREALGVLQSAKGRWVDLGTGAGFPGIVFAALFPLASIELVDSRTKRCAFLDRVLATSPVATENISVTCARLETLEDHSYDGLLSRALAPPPLMLEHARRLLKPGGSLVLMLQDDGLIPETRDFKVTQLIHYVLDDKARKSALLNWRPTADND
jgi:16S rRNA (guanine527-N7)-methyltransferase